MSKGAMIFLGAVLAVLGACSRVDNIPSGAIVESDLPESRIHDGLSIDSNANCAGPECAEPGNGDPRPPEE